MPSLDLNGETARASQRCAARRVHGAAAARDAEVQARQAARRLLARQRLQGDRLRADHRGRSGRLDGRAPGGCAPVESRQRASCRLLQKKSRWPSSTPALERTIKEKNPFLDVEMFRTKLGEIEAQVCRIEIDTPRGTVYGTGFLLGPDVLMTNHHVMESVDRPARCRPRLPYSASITSGCRPRSSPTDRRSSWRPTGSSTTVRRAPSISSPSRSRARRVRTSSTTRSCALPVRPATQPVGAENRSQCTEARMDQAARPGRACRRGVAAAHHAAPRLGAAEARDGHERRDRSQRERHAAQVQGEHRRGLVRRALFQHRHSTFSHCITAAIRTSIPRTSRNTTRASRSTRS